VALVLMVGYSVAYRWANPSLTIHRSHSHAPEQNDMTDMIGSLMQRLEHNPEDADALRGLGQAFMRMQAWSQARRFWERLVAVEPGNTDARQRLAMCLFRLEEYAAAADELTQVLQTEPDNGYALFNLGVLYTHYLHDPKQGTAYFQSIVDSPGVSPEIKDQAQEQLEARNGG
jgi:cytochrome c-type biogenesis protein CcmH/NrfG